MVRSDKGILETLVVSGIDETFEIEYTERTTNNRKHTKTTWIIVNDNTFCLNNDEAGCITKEH